MADTCPHCDLEIADSLTLGDEPVAPGWMCLCLHCNELCEYGPDLQLIKPTQKTLEEADLVTLQHVKALANRMREQGLANMNK